MIRFKKEDSSNYPAIKIMKIKDICTVTNGKGNTQDKIDDGIYPFYVRSDNVERSNKYIFDNEAIITSGDGVGVGKIFHYVNGKYNLHQRCYACFDFKDVNCKYFYYYFSTFFYRRVKRLSAKGSVDSVRLDFITEMDIKVPCLEEQQKIADFLSYIDDVITASEQEVVNLKEQKKGVMQKIFSQEVRFKADDGSDYPEWEEKRIADLFKISAGGDIDKDNSSDEKTEEYIYPVYANSLTNDGLYGYANYYKVNGETLTVTGRGDVGHATARHTSYVPIVRLLVLEPIKQQSVDFFAEVINSTRILIESTGVPQLTAPQIGKIKVSAPCYEEQKKIADFLSDIDTAIDLAKQELEQWKELKKGLLQQLFE
jgi:type I restriction enzyme S subunit